MRNLPARLWESAGGPAPGGKPRGGAPSRLPGPLPPHAGETSGPPRVVVVDDNDDFRESLIALLHAGGIEVLGEAVSGAEALDLARRLRPDVVLMDVRMPGMDGVETTSRLKANHPEIRVIAVTAQEDQTVVREMLVAGASGYVTKDSTGDDILQAVSEAALGGAVLSPAVTPVVIEQLTTALEGERQRAAELEEAHLALIERVGRRHDLVARLGHELRTPVTVILGLARTLASRDLHHDERADLLGRMVTRAESLARLTERFETAMDATSGDLVDVPMLVGQAADGRPRVRVEVQGAVSPAWASPMLARRILEELLDNACRFSPPDSEVRIEVREGFGSIEVRVCDRGDGVRDDDRERIFEPLEQAEALDSRTHQGVGVGLSLGRAAARAMDGDLVLESTGSAGSIFLWTLATAER